MSNGAGGATAQTRQPGTAGAPAVALAEVNITFRLADGGSYAAVERASLDVADGVAEPIARSFQLVEAAEGAFMNFLLDRLGDAALDPGGPA